MNLTFEQAIDERITKSKGNHIMKQYKTGYLYQFDIYVAKKTASPELGLSRSVVMQLTEFLKNSCCRIFCDNFYTSPQPVYRLMKKHFFLWNSPRILTGTSQRYEINERSDKEKN